MMFRLALRTLHFRTGGFVATFVAVLCGAAIVIACGGLLETGIRTDVPPQRLAAAEVVVAGNQAYHADGKSGNFPERVRIDSALRNRISSVPGVVSVVADLSFPAAVLRDGEPVADTSQGHGWASAQLGPSRLSAGAAPSAAKDVVLDSASARNAAVQVGGQVQVAVDGVQRSYRVSGIVDSGARPTVFFADSVAGRLYGHPGKVDVFGVLAKTGADAGALSERITAVLSSTDTVALTGDDRGTAEFPQAPAGGRNLIITAGVFGGMAIMIALFVIASTLGLTVQQRLREMALLRAIGATPRQIRTMILGEAIVVATLAAALGVAPGLFLGDALFGQLVSHGVVLDVLRFHQGWIPAVAGAAVALSTAFVAALITGRRAGNIAPTEALAEAAVSTRWLSPTRLILALVFIGGGVALQIVTVTVMVGPLASATAGPASMVWAIGVALLAPGITRMMVALLARPIRAISGVPGYLASLNVRARVIGVAAAVTPIMLATGIALANLYQQTTQEAAIEHAYTEHLRADHVLSSPIGMSAATIDQIRSLPAVAGASAVVDSSGWLVKPQGDANPERPWSLMGLDAQGIGQTTDVPLAAGSLSGLTGNTIAVPVHLAALMDIVVGDTITVRLGDNAMVDLVVVALPDDRRGFEKFYLPATLLAAHTSAGLPTQVLVRALPGADPSEALAELAARYPGAVVGAADSLVLGATQSQSTQAWVSYMMIAVVIGYTAISVANTLVMATARRRREFGLQRLAGSTKRQVFQMLGVECAFVALIGIILGSVVSLTTLVPFSLVVGDSLVPSGPVSIYLGVILAAVGITVVATLVPARLAMRPRPAETAAAVE